VYWFSGNVKRCHLDTQMTTEEDEQSTATRLLNETTTSMAELTSYHHVIYPSASIAT
jgi:hypothetical protein